MGWTRHTGTVVSLAALSSVVANYAVHQHFERIHSRAGTAQLAAAPPGALIFDAPLRSHSDDAQPTVPRFLEELSGIDGPVTPALQIRDVTPGDSREDPGPVPVPGDPCPLAENSEPGEARPLESQGLNAVRKVIEEELAGSSQEERDIWFEELKSIPAGVVRDLLQVRKQLRALPRALHRMDPVTTLVPIPAPRVAELSAEPASQMRRQPMIPEWGQTVAALEQSCAIARHNLANSATPGFKRLRATLVDCYGPLWNVESRAADGSGVASPAARLGLLQVEGCRQSEPILDLKEGTLHPTGRQLDLAIDGVGFFPVLVNGDLTYTRCGAMVLNARRRICLAVNEGLAELQPIIEIPADAREIQISADGSVRVLVKLGADPVPVGRLQLAHFPSPSLLRPIGGTLLVPTEASGEVELAAANEGGRGGVQQGCLEQSNVDPELELAEIERLQTLLKSFPLGGRPVTASGQEQRSR